MKRVMKSILSIIIVFAILFGAAPLSGFKGVGSSVWHGLCSIAASAKEGVEDIIETLTPANVPDNTLAATGKCGENVYWTFDEATGLLTISGEGKMYDYNESQYDTFFYVYSLFNGNKSIKAVIIENGITNIGSYSFYGCSNLTSIEIPDGVTSIGDSAFYGCSNLTSIEIPDSVTSIGDDAFKVCSSITSLTIPDGVTSIEKRLFSHCYSLINIDIPESVTSIGDEAFYDCTSLKSVTIPDSVTSIGSYAFSRCSSLASITIPDSVTSVVSCAFMECISLKSIKIGNGVTSIGVRAFYNTGYYNDESNWENDALYIGNYLIEAKESLNGAYSIRCGTTCIAGRAFYNCESLTSVVIPDSVKVIYESTFSNCTSLTSIEIPDSVTSIGCSAFSGCSSLTAVYISDIDSWAQIGLYGYDSNPLYFAKNLYLNNELATDVVLSDNVTKISSWAFYGCSSLTSIEIPDSVTSIGYAAFYGCTGLTSITIPDSVMSIDGSAFSGCSSLASVEIPDSVTSIGACAFYGCSSLTSIEIPDGVTNIYVQTFYGCTSLTSIKIPDSVTNIGKKAFYNTGYYNRNFHGDVLYIGNHLIKARSDIRGGYKIKNGTKCIAYEAFYKCYSLTSIEIPDSVTSINIDAFNSCNDLRSIIIPDSVTSIGKGAFDYCSSLKNVYISDIDAWAQIDFASGFSYPLNLYLNNEIVTDVVLSDNVTKISGKAFRNCSSLASITIPDSVTSIGAGAFSNCTSLTSIEIPDSVTSIGGSAFFGCSSLTSIEIPDSVTSIGGSAFSGCSSLTSIEIPEDVTSIGDYVFADCTSLTSIEIPDSVTSIGEYVFRDCSSLTSIEIPDSVTSIGEYAFYGCTALTSIEIPDSVTSIGGSAFSGCSSLRSITIPDSVTSIGAGAFSNCTSLTSVTFGNSLTSIGYSAFSNCIFLTSIEIPNSVTSIGKYVFRNCNSLTSVTIPDSVTRIDAGAFYGCTGLTGIVIPNSVTRIGDDAFYGCTALTNIEIPKSVNYIGSKVFAGCTSLSDISVSADNKDYSSDAYGVLYNKGKTILKQYPAGNERTSFVVPESVTSISGYAFYCSTKITFIEIPVSVTSIGSHAFDGCYNITDVDYSGSQEEWGKISIYDGNDYLKRATIHFNSESLGNGNVSAYVEWYDSDRGNGSTTLKFGSNLISNPSTVYNHQLAQLSSQLVTIGYATEYRITKALNAIGLDGVEIRKNTGRDEEDYFFANRKIEVNGKEYTFVVAGLIGSNGAQWASNFDPQGHESDNRGYPEEIAKNYHLGFYDAKEFVKSYFSSYLNNLGVAKENVKILICGHSRGAAASDLLAADLIDSQKYAFADNIYTYTFATPNSTSKTVANNSNYNRIFNFINPEDLVTKLLPSDWGYTRLGLSIPLPCKGKTVYYNTYKKNMVEQFNQLSKGKEYNSYDGEKALRDTIQVLVNRLGVRNDCKQAMQKYYFEEIQAFFNDEQMFSYYEYFQDCVVPAVDGSKNFEPIKGTLITGNTPFKEFTGFLAWESEEYFGKPPGHKFGDAHCPHLYCAYLLTMSRAQVLTFGAARCVTVNCPVDVEVYEKDTGELVGRIVNNVVDEDIAAKENAVNMYVEGDQKEFWLPSDGNYEVKLIGNDNGTMDYSVAEIDVDSAETKRVNFFDVPVENGKAYEAEMNEKTTLDDYTIESPTGNDVAPTENMTGDEIISYNINVTTEGDGYATNSITVTSGERVNLEATPEEGANFLGWYENGAKISTEMELSFVVKSDRNITAKFSEKALPSVKSVSIGDISLDYKSSATLTPQITADEGASYTVTYSSSNPSVSTVNNSGEVYGAGVGTATITVSVTDTNGNTVTDTCTATVKALPSVKSVSIGDTSLNYKSSATLTPQITADEGASYTVTYTSSNPSVATVNNNGTVYGSGVGTATITVTVTDTNGNTVTDTCTVTVKPLPSVKSVSIGDLSLNYKSSATITPQITADNGASYTVSYTSSNPSVATVDANGKVTSVKQSGLNRGSTVITCTVTDSYGNTVTDTCTVTVEFAWWQWLIKIALFGWIWY